MTTKTNIQEFREKIKGLLLKYDQGGWPDPYIEMFESLLSQELTKQREDLIERLHQEKNLIPGGQIKVNDLKTFDLNSWKDGIDKAIEIVKEVTE